MPDELEYKFPDFEYLVDDFFPTQEIHLIAGPTGAGKTTWLLRFLDQWRKGEPIFGKASHPVPFVYVSLDRSENGMLRVFERMKLDPRPFLSRLMTVQQRDRKSGIEFILQKIRTRFPDAKLIIIEGLALLVNNLNDQKEVGAYLSTMRDFLVKHDLTVIGTVHSAKQKHNAKYENPRERIAGCQTWGGMAETVVMIEPNTDSSGIEAETRTFQFLVRNFPKIVLIMEFKDGILVEKEKNLSAEQKVLAYLASRAPDELHPIETLKTASGLKSDSRIFELLSTLQKTGRLTRLASEGDARRSVYKYLPPKAQA